MQLISFIVTTSLLANVIADVREVEFFDQQARDLFDSSSLNDTYSAYHLKNKLEVIIHEHEDFTKKIQVSLAVGVGTSGVSKHHPVWQQRKMDGLPHLLEHCLFIANENFTVHYDIVKFTWLHGGFMNAFTANDHTVYELQFPHGNNLSEALSRFASMFISPLFPAEPIQTQIAIVNNEFLGKRDTEIFDRLPQLFMTKGEPSELFYTGNSNSLNGVLPAEVEQFWKTHYFADNMKLAISVHRVFKDTVKKALSDYFVNIPEASAEMIVPPLKYAPAPFWAEDHKDQYLKVYTQNARRNNLHFYWHIHCDKGDVCRDSLLMIVLSIQATFSYEFPKHIYKAYYKDYSYDEYIIYIKVVLRNKELPDLTFLKNQIIETIMAKAPTILTFNDEKYGSNCPENLSTRLSELMLITDSLTQVPLRAHVHALFDESAKNLKNELWKTLQENVPRVAVSYKADFFKDLSEDETLLVDPYYSIHYQFVDDLGEAALAPVDQSSELSQSKSVLSMEIGHHTISFPFHFLRGVFIEVIRIILKEKQLKFVSVLDNDSFKFDIQFENPEMWKDTMKGVMEALADPSEAVLEKANNRWLKEINNDASLLHFNSVALEYAKVFLNSPYTFNVYFPLISDPSPKSVSLEKFKIIRGIFQKLGNLKVTSHLMLNANDVEDVMTEMWESWVPKSTSYSVNRREYGQTLIYSPPPLQTGNSGVMMISELSLNDSSYFQIMKSILEPYIFARLRNDMKLTYAPQISLLSLNQFCIMVPSAHTPDYVLNCLTSVINEIPNYMQSLSDKEWNSYVDSCYWKNIHDRELLLSVGGREILIRKVQDTFITEKERNRLIIQFWGKSQGAARNAYLSEIIQAPPPNTTIITSIEEYPHNK